MKQLDAGYTYEVDNVNKDTWHNLLCEFDDAAFYQTWSYGSISWGEKNLSHIILMKDEEIVAIAQLRIAKPPLLKIGFAYLTWGPIWRKKGKKPDTEILRNMLRALYNEYAIHCRYLLRIIPRQIHEDEENIRKIFDDENFSWSPDPMQTVYVDLAPSLDEIKKNTRPKWRQTLNRALKQEMEFTEGSNDELCDTALRIIKEMKKRKRYVEFGSMEDMIAVNKDLPENLKLKFALCSYENEPIATLGWFPIGKIGQPLVGATGDNALKLNASYPLWWKMVEYYKNQGSSCIDLAGINKERNPGGYIFKTGVAGKNRKEKRYIGQFNACENFLSSFCFKTGMSLREHYRNLIVKINKLFK